jgi:hypothetical protein
MATHKKTETQSYTTELLQTTKTKATEKCALCRRECVEHSQYLVRGEITRTEEHGEKTKQSTRKLEGTLSVHFDALDECCGSSWAGPEIDDDQEMLLISLVLDNSFSS